MSDLLYQVFFYVPWLNHTYQSGSNKIYSQSVYFARNRLIDQSNVNQYGNKEMTILKSSDYRVRLIKYK